MVPGPRTSPILTLVYSINSELVGRFRVLFLEFIRLKSVKEILDCALIKYKYREFFKKMYDIIKYSKFFSLVINN